jgi:hypothetical protein
MPWKETDAVKQRMKFLLEWESRWRAARWPDQLRGAVPGARGEPTGRLRLGRAIPQGAARRERRCRAFATAPFSAAAV